jgi:GTPase
MAKNRKIEQQIAVFGKSGSGKTVLVSSLLWGDSEAGVQGQRVGLRALPWTVAGLTVGVAVALLYGWEGPRRMLWEREGDDPADDQLADDESDHQ